VPLKTVPFLVFLLNLFSLLDDRVNVVSKQFWESEHCTTSGLPVEPFLAWPNAHG